MIIALVWNDTKSFQKHMEWMRRFRQSHFDNPEGGLSHLKELPAPSGIFSPSKTGGVGGLTSMKGKHIIVPIWKIVIPRNSQN